MQCIQQAYTDDRPTIGRRPAGLLCSVVTVALSCTGVTQGRRNWYHSIACLSALNTRSLRYLPLKTTVTWKPRLVVIWGLWKWQYSIDRLWLHIHIL